MSADKKSTEMPSSGHRVLLRPPGLSDAMDSWSVSEIDSYMRRGIGEIAEDLISKSALTILISDQILPYVQSLPGPIRDLCETFDEEWIVERKRALLAPLEDEYSVQFLELGVIFRKSSKLSLEQTMSMMRISECLYQFLAGMQWRAEIELPILKFKESVSLLRASAVSPDSRAILARLEGLLNTYKSTDVPALRHSSNATPELASAFVRLCEDAEYRRLSASVHSLSVGQRAVQSMRVSRRAARAVVKSPAFAPLFKFGGRLLQVFTGAPVPDADLPALIGGGVYMPPISEA